MTVPEKSNRMSSRQKVLLFGISIAGLVVVSILVILWPRSSCEGIFEQTAPRLEANLEIVNNKGAFAVAHEQIQELSESAQKVGLHLNTCCSVLDGGKLNPPQFQQCIDIASAYDRQVAFVAQQVTEGAEARERGDDELLQEKTVNINEAIQTATSRAENFARQIAQIAPLIDNLPPVNGGYASIRVRISGGTGIGYIGQTLPRYKVLVNENQIGIYETPQNIVFDRFLRPGMENTISWEFTEAGPRIRTYVKYEDTSEDWFHVYDFYAREDRLQGGVSFPFGNRIGD